MASPTWWTWVWMNSGRWWWTGRLGVLRFMRLQRVRHNWATEVNWTMYIMNVLYVIHLQVHTHTSLEDYTPNAMFKSAQAAITKYHRLGGLKHRHWFLTIQEAGKSEMRVLAWLGTSLQRVALLLYPHMGERGKEGREGNRKKEFSDFVLQGHYGIIIRTPLWWLHWNLITSQRPHVIILLHWVIELQHMNLTGPGTHTFSP